MQKNVKFIVTGSMRSGTTYMASILNSQNNMFCLEDFPWHFIPKKFSTREEFLCFSNSLDAKFIYLGLPSPKIAKSLGVGDDVLTHYIDHLTKIYGTSNYGFKRTLLSKKELVEFEEQGFKIIILRRSTEDILKSWVTRIEPDLDHAAYRLQRFLNEINYYEPDLPKQSYLVVQFDDLIKNTDHILDITSEFLGAKIQKVDQLFHSFNKGRFNFEQNTSFNLSDRKMYVDELSTRLSADEIKKVAHLVDANSYKLPIQKAAKRKFKNFILSLR